MNITNKFKIRMSILETRNSFPHNGDNKIKRDIYNSHQGCTCQPKRVCGDTGPMAIRMFSSKRKHKIDIGTIKTVPKVFIVLLEDYVSKLKLTYSIGEISEQIVNLHNQLIRDHGIKDGTKRFNNIRLYIINIMEKKHTPETPPFMALSKKYKFPSKLFKMLDLYRLVIEKQCNISDRTIRSLFYINRLVSDYNEVDLTNVVKTYTVPSEFSVKFRKYIRYWKVENKYQHSPDLITEPTEKFVRNGPNGKPKFQTADIEAKKLYNSSLWKPFFNICNLTGNQNLANFVFELNRNSVNSKKKIDKIRLRYITSIADKGNKARLVAISDYWTQIALLPLMRDVKSLTEKYFNGFSSSTSHSAGFINLKRFMKVGIKSYDITSWTDAFPASLQKIVLEELYSPELAQAWYDLVVTCEWNVKGKDSTVKYGTGQGMGTAGSFDIAMLTDMFVLAFIYNEDYKIDIFKSKSNGNILFNKVGDDLWCYDPQMKVHHHYTKTLGMEINLGKTKQATHENLCGEYVSRNLNYNRDVSRISANICRAVSKNILDIPELARHLEERDVKYLPIRKILEICNVENITLLLRVFYLSCLFFPSREGHKVLKYSIRHDYLHFIASDPVISLLQGKNIENLKYAFLIRGIEEILPMIQEKMKELFSTRIDGYECSLDLISDNTKGMSFKYRNDTSINENLEFITSKWIYAKCMRLVNSLSFVLQPKPSGLDSEYNKIMSPMVTKASEQEQNVVKLSQLEYVLDELTTILQGLTFKELGKIGTDKKPYRPTTTKIYNYLKNIVPLDNYEPFFDCEDRIWNVTEQTKLDTSPIKPGALFGGKFVPKNGTTPLIGVSFPRES